MKIVLQPTGRFSTFTLQSLGEAGNAKKDERRTSKFLSDQLVLATKGAVDIQLDSAEVRAVLEPHLAKSRSAREAALKLNAELGLASLEVVSIGSA